MPMRALSTRLLGLCLAAALGQFMIPLAAAQCQGQWLPGPPDYLTIYDLQILPDGSLAAADHTGVRRWDGVSWESMGVFPGETWTIGVMSDGRVVAASVPVGEFPSWTSLTRC
ncbi:MAG: hypothetical protein R3B68_08025 [Phycisphaerales bacterium]